MEYNGRKVDYDDESAVKLPVSDANGIDSREDRCLVRTPHASAATTMATKGLTRFKKVAESDHLA